MLTAVSRTKDTILEAPRRFNEQNGGVVDSLRVVPLHATNETEREFSRKENGSLGKPTSDLCRNFGAPQKLKDPKTFATMPSDIGKLGGHVKEPIDGYSAILRVR